MSQNGSTEGTSEVGSHREVANSGAGRAAPALQCRGVVFLCTGNTYCSRWLIIKGQGRIRLGGAIKLKSPEEQMHWSIGKSRRHMENLG